MLALICEIFYAALDTDTQDRELIEDCKTVLGTVSKPDDVALATARIIKKHPEVAAAV